jgi:hypothetical protein
MTSRRYYCDVTGRHERNDRFANDEDGPQLVSLDEMVRVEVKLVHLFGRQVGDHVHVHFDHNRNPQERLLSGPPTR